MEVMTFAKEIIITAFVGHLGPLELSSLVLAQVIPRVCLLPLDITIYL
jgi:MATE family multidrug resistance protein